ncbi:MAG: hypothetical protein WD648_13265 [Planctomycetaceae bacterium]
MEPRQISDVLAGLKRRQRMLNSAAWGLRGLFAGSIIALVTASGFAIAGFEPGVDRPWNLFWLVPASGCLGLLLGALRRIDALQLARALDHAADSEDRFTSAMQLVGHHRRERVQLIVVDAMHHISGVEAKRVLPFSTPKVGRWLPGVIGAFALLLWLAPGRNTTAALSPEPEVTAEQWRELEEKFSRELKRNYEAPKSHVEKELHERLKQLTSSLARQPEKKQVLAGIAKMRTDIEKRRRELKTGNLNMKQAAAALQSSELLKKLAELLKKGDYANASEELKRLAEQLKASKVNPTAAELEAIAKDFERLARELSEHEGLHKNCEQCASAAAALNQQELADALQRLSKQLDENREDLKQCESLCKACSSLDDLEQMLSRMKSNKQCSVCQGKNSGQCPACSGSSALAGFVQRPGSKKGGLKAGTGTAAKWDRGGLNDNLQKNIASGVPDQERGGTQSTVSKTLSADERADSALAFKEKYVKLVQQAEADLALENIPFTYRDFLRRYFSGIKPQEKRPDASGDPAESVRE